METDLLFSLIVLILVSRLLGFLFTKYEYQSMIGEVIGGFVLGPMILGIIHPTDSLTVFADFGILLIMLVAGMETNFNAFKQNMKGSVIVAVLGVIATFVVVYFPLVALGFGWDTALFLSAIMSNSAIEVCASIFSNSSHPTLRSVVLGASFVDDILAVFLLGIVSSAVLGNTPLTSENIAIISIKIIIFMVISFFVISLLIDRLMDRIRAGEGSEKLLLTTTILTALAFGIAARLVGLNAVIGAYIGGLVIGKWGMKVGPMLKRRIAWNRMMDDLNAMLKAIFSPLFFGYVGLALSYYTVGSSNILLIVAMVGLFVGLGFAGKYIGCGLGAKLSGLSGKGSFMVATAMLGRGALEMILARYAVETGVISEDIFDALILFVLVTIIVAPLLYGYTNKQWGDQVDE